jgi:hypothetical protein
LITINLQHSGLLETGRSAQEQAGRLAHQGAATITIDGRILLQLCPRPRRFITRTAASLLALILSFAAPATLAEPFSEYDLLLLDLTLERERLAQSVTAYTVNGTIVISLTEAAVALEFPITVDPANGTAKGWFLSKERNFALDINAATVTVEGTTTPLTASDAMLHEEAIYVPLATFSRWFPVTLTADLTTLTIKVEPREPLPVQKRAERRKLAGTRFVQTPPSLPEVAMPYRLIGPHTADLALGYNIRRNTASTDSSADTSLTHSILMRGELAYMGSTIYLNGNDTDALTVARMTLLRDQPDTPPGISQIQIGDITPAVLSGAPQADIERGLLIKGATFRDADLYNLDGTKTNISGNVLPGWEVELLHNGIRVDYQIIGAEGLYDFRDLDLYSGANTFELIFYGPSGERRSEIITRYAGADTIRKGNLGYQVTASQKGTPLYETDSDTNSDMSDRGSGRYTARLDYGLFANLSLRAGWNSAVDNGERLNYYSAGFRTGWRDLYVTVDGTLDPLGGTIWDGAIHTPVTMRLWGFNTQLQHTQYATSVIATDQTSDLQITSRSSVVLSRSARNISSRLSASHNRLTNGSTTIYSADLSTYTGVHRIGNALNYQDFDNENTLEQPTQFTGNLYFHSKLDPIDIRGNIFYQLQPESEALQYQLKADLRIAQDMGMYFGLDYTPATDYSLYTAGLNWQLQYVTLAPRINYDSNDDYTGFIYLSTSFAPKPDRRGVIISGQSMANNGGVASRVFVDNDNNGRFDNSDTPVADATVYASQLFRHATTDEHGSAYLTALRPGKASDIRLDPATLPDIAMIATHPGNSVRPRAARWAVIDFPVIASGEIDGNLYRRQDDDSLAPQPGMVVELRDANDEVIAIKVSGQDGFFLFDQLPLGDYTVTLPEESRERLTSPPAKASLSQAEPSQGRIELVVSPLKSAPRSLLPGGRKGAIAPIIQKGVIPPAPLAPPPAAAPVIIAPAPPPQAVTAPYMLQLGALGSQAKAEAAMSQLRQRHGPLLAGLELRIERIDLGAKGVFYRIYATGNMTANEAKARCQQLGQQGQNCIAIPQKTPGTP